MHALLAVAQGSVLEPRFIVLEYKGNDAAPVVLVGKGITFDTGGISIKPAPSMEEMKYDMSGAAAVLGTFEVLGRLQPDMHVIGLVPTCENMPSGSAYRPGEPDESAGDRDRSSIAFALLIVVRRFQNCNVVTDCRGQRRAVSGRECSVDAIALRAQLRVGNAAAQIARTPRKGYCNHSSQRRSSRFQVSKPSAKRQHGAKYDSIYNLVIITLSRRLSVARSADNER